MEVVVPKNGTLGRSIYMSIRHLDDAVFILPEERHEMIQKGEESLKLCDTVPGSRLLSRNRLTNDSMSKRSKRLQATSQVSDKHCHNFYAEGKYKN